MELQNRLRELRVSNNFSQKDFFDKVVKAQLKIDITLRTYQNWENPKNVIKAIPAQTLANYFGVSVGYLLGNSDYKNPLDFINYEMNRTDGRLYPDEGGDSDSPIDPYLMLASVTIGETASDKLREAILQLADDDKHVAGKYVNAINRLPLDLQNLLVHFLLVPQSSKDAVRELVKSLASLDN